MVPFMTFNTLIKRMDSITKIFEAKLVKQLPTNFAIFDGWSTEDTDYI